MNDSLALAILIGQRDRLARCVCSHPSAIHIGGGVCFRCKCGMFAASAAGYTFAEKAAWVIWLDAA